MDFEYSKRRDDTSDKATSRSDAPASLSFKADRPLSVANKLLRKTVQKIINRKINIKVQIHTFTKGEINSDEGELVWPDCIGDEACYRTDAGGTISVASLSFITKKQTLSGGLIEIVFNAQARVTKFLQLTRIDRIHHQNDYYRVCSEEIYQLSEYWYKD